MRASAPPAARLVGVHAHRESAVPLAQRLRAAGSSRRRRPAPLPQPHPEERAPLRLPSGAQRAARTTGRRSAAAACARQRGPARRAEVRKGGRGDREVQRPRLQPPPPQLLPPPPHRLGEPSGKPLPARLCGVRDGRRLPPTPRGHGWARLHAERLPSRRWYPLTLCAAARQQAFAAARDAALPTTAAAPAAESKQTRAPFWAAGRMRWTPLPEVLL